MASKLNTNEGVTPSGTTITSGNSGGTSGDAWQSTSSAGATLASDNTHAVHGSLSMKVATTTSATSFTTWTLTASGTWFFRHYFWVDSITAATNPSLMRFRGTTDTVQVIRATFDATGHLQLRNTANTVVGTSTNPFGLSQWNRLEGFATPGAGTTTGSGELKLFVGDSTTVVAGTTITVSGQNFGSVTNIDAVSFGQVVAFVSLPVEWLDDFAVSNVAYIGPSVQTLSPASIASTEAFGPATALPGVRTLNPASIASAQSFGAVLLSPGPVTLHPASIPSAQSVPTPTLTPGSFALHPASIPTAEAFGPATALPGAVTLHPASIPTAESVPVPTSTIVPPLLILRPASIASAESFGLAGAGPTGTQILHVPSILSEEAFGPVIAGRISPVRGACCDGEQFRGPCCSDSIADADEEQED